MADHPTVNGRNIEPALCRGHSIENRLRIQRMPGQLFAQGQLPDEMPEFALPAEAVSVKQPLLACKLVETGGEAKRMCAQSAVSIDDEKMPDPNAQIIPGGGMTMQVGKRRFARLKVKD